MTGSNTKTVVGAVALSATSSLEASGVCIVVASVGSA
jgi:hypothetical protein